MRPSCDSIFDSGIPARDHVLDEGGRTKVSGAGTDGDAGQHERAIEPDFADGQCRKEALSCDNETGKSRSRRRARRILRSLGGSLQVVNGVMLSQMTTNHLL
jgi:hypothetical protein